MYLNSNEEQVAKDLHLRKIALGELDGKMTGYTSVDKPWLKYYDEETLKKEFVPMSIYQLMKKKPYKIKPLTSQEQSLLLKRR